MTIEELRAEIERLEKKCDDLESECLTWRYLYGQVSVD
jgi:hypothetical protein